MRNYNLQFYINKIQSGEPFKFLRFGDGEWYAVRGGKKDIAKGEHAMSEELTEDLRYITSHLKKEDINGLQPLSTTIPVLKDLIPECDWVNSDVFHSASLAGELKPFFQVLHGKTVVIVGRERLRAIKKIVNYKDFIEVSDSNCYDDRHKIYSKFYNYPSGTIFLFCASRLSVPAIYHCRRRDITMIDLGSLFDPYIGVSSRKYHKRMTKEIIQKNLP